MTAKEQTDAFSNDLDKLVERYADEFDLQYAQILGILNFKAFLLMQQAAEEGDGI